MGVCPTLTDVPAQIRRPPEEDQIEDNLRRCELYTLTPQTCAACADMTKLRVSSRTKPALKKEQKTQMSTFSLFTTSVILEKTRRVGAGHLVEPDQIHKQTA